LGQGVWKIYCCVSAGITFGDKPGHFMEGLLPMPGHGIPVSAWLASIRVARFLATASAHSLCKGMIIATGDCNC